MTAAVVVSLSRLCPSLFKGYCDGHGPKTGTRQGCEQSNELKQLPSFLQQKGSSSELL